MGENMWKCQLRQWLECYPQSRCARLSFCVNCCSYYYLSLHPSTSYTSQLKTKMHVAHPSLCYNRYHIDTQAAQWVYGRQLPWQHILSHVGLWSEVQCFWTSPLFFPLHCCLTAADLSGNAKLNEISWSLALYISASKPFTTITSYTLQDVRIYGIMSSFHSLSSTTSPCVQVWKSSN